MSNRVISFDRCVKCDYSLHQLSVEGRCPECGEPIVMSLNGNADVSAGGIQGRRLKRLAAWLRRPVLAVLLCNAFFMPVAAIVRAHSVIFLLTFANAMCIAAMALPVIVNARWLPFTPKLPLVLLLSLVTLGAFVTCAGAIITSMHDDFSTIVLYATMSASISLAVTMAVLQAMWRWAVGSPAAQSKAWILAVALVALSSMPGLLLGLGGYTATEFFRTTAGFTIAVISCVPAVGAVVYVWTFVCQVMDSFPAW